MDDARNAQKGASPIHPIIRDCDEFLNDIRQSLGRSNGGNSPRLSTFVDEEILQSFHVLRDTNSRLQRRIQAEQQRLYSLQNILDEYLDIERTLEQSKIRPEVTEAIIEQDAIQSGAQENYRAPYSVIDDTDQLHDDLMYITSCIEEKLINKNIDTSTQQSQFKSLNETILQFVKQRLDFPDQPYLDQSMLMTDINPNHLEILREALIIEPYQDNPNQVALVDYAQDETHPM